MSRTTRLSVSLVALTVSMFTVGAVLVHGCDDAKRSDTPASGDGGPLGTIDAPGPNPSGDVTRDPVMAHVLRMVDDG